MFTEQQIISINRVYELLNSILKAIDEGDISENIIDTEAAGEAVAELEIAFEEIIDVKEVSDPDPGQMDGDLLSGLASAGMGTDENYGNAADVV